MLQPYLDRFDKAIEAGLSQLNWETGGLEPEIAKRREFIDEAILAVETVDEITCTMKANLEKVQTIMEKWSAKPLMDRKAKPQELEYFERVFKQSKATRYGEIMPRHKWCFKYPAQVVLTGSLIYWRSSTTSPTP